MNPHRSDGMVPDGIRLSTVPRDVKSAKGSPAAEDAREAYDRECFPDGFYQGVIVSLDRVRGRGLIRSHSGREIRFEFPFVGVAGAPLGGRAPGIELLQQGDRVGFDVGWTSKGLRVTRIKPTRTEDSE
jgi:hypothetical protein